MKTNVSVIILFFLYLLSSYSNAEDLHFRWKLEHLGQLVLNGKVTSSTHSGHSEATREGYWDALTNYLSGISGDHFVIYDLLSDTNIEFYPHDPTINVPDFFHGLLGNASHDLLHSFHTRYTLRGQTTTKTGSIAQLLCCIFCLPCFLSSKIINQDILEQEAKLRELETATPDHLPEHVTIDSRSMAHITMTSHYETLSSSNTEVIDDDIHIFDLFLRNPETQKWITGYLNSETYLTHEFIIPGLFNTARPAEVLVQERDSENESEDDDTLKPTDFVSLYFDDGTVLRYHLKRSLTNDLQVLAISVSSNYYTLSFVINNYDALANQPPLILSWAELRFFDPCDCSGACNCALPRYNNRDGSNYESVTH